MANVLFKQGLQTSLDTIRQNKNAVEGAFYLTTDSHRLYIGRAVEGQAGKVDAVPVNEGVTTVATTGDLPTISSSNKDLYTGQFYYVTGSNILCIYNGSGDQEGWVQINPNTDTYVDDLIIGVAVINGVATVTTSVKTLGDKGRTESDSFTVTGANGVEVSNSGKDLTITGDTYTLGKEFAGDNKKVTLKLDSANVPANSSSVVLEGGSNVSITADAGKIKIDSDNTTLKENGVTAGAGNGIPTGTTGTSPSGFYVKVTDSSNNSAIGTIDPGIKISNTTYKFSNGVADLNDVLYTKAEIDNKVNTLNAMVYKGTLGTGGSITSIPTANVHIGDTYLIVGEDAGITVPGSTRKAFTGDLIIARGTENTSGVITSVSLEWDVIPSGDDTAIDTNYVGVAIDHGMSLKSSTNNTVVASISVEGDGTYITTSDVVSTDKQTNKVTLTHADTTRTDTDNTTTEKTISQENVDSIEVTAVTGVTTNSAGHVTGVTTQKYNIVDTNSEVSAVTNTAAAATIANVASAVNLTTSVTTKKANNATTTKTGTIGVGSNSLTVASSASGITVDMVWGTF